MRYRKMAKPDMEDLYRIYKEVLTFCNEPIEDENGKIHYEKAKESILNCLSRYFETRGNNEANPS
ncbi:MAG: hypothetical protein M3Q97_04300 [Bacteroidota bacterium]|nr:hypothetical protein [Bacteroidota bacterium]